jgi:hypothetical protein
VPSHPLLIWRRHCCRATHCFPLRASRVSNFSWIFSPRLLKAAARQLLHPLSAHQLALAEVTIGEATQLVSEITAEHEVFRPAALEAETANVRALLAAGTSWFRRWKGAYRAASAALESWLAVPIPKSTAERVSFVVGHCGATRTQAFPLFS